MALGKWLFSLSVAALLISGTAQAASAPAVEAKNGMVVSSQYLASQVGVDIMKMGGNAIDAAVSGKVREGYLYGANDIRRPAGAAIGY